MNVYDNMPLVTLFAMAALPTVNSHDKSPKEVAETAFEIAKYMEILHHQNRPVPGAVRKVGDIPVGKRE